MLVRILRDVFESKDHLKELDNLLTHFRKGKHTLLIDYFDDIDAYQNSEWKKELNSRDIKLIDAYIKNSVRFNKSYKSIDISLKNPEDRFSPREADLYLTQPLVILLENSEYDPPFTNAIFKHFDKDNILLDAKTEQYWKYGMGGGSSISNVINSEILESFEDKSFVKPKKKYLRYFVILDSDKKFPEMVVEPSKHKILDDNEVPYHILYKREKENYMPLAILRKLNSPFLDIYINFKTNEQRDFFDLEKGFNQKPFSSLIKEIQELYPATDIPTEPYKILRNGMDLDAYKSGKLKREFSKLFAETSREEMYSSISHQPMYERNNEFEQIISEIKKIL